MEDMGECLVLLINKVLDTQQMQTAAMGAIIQKQIAAAAAIGAILYIFGGLLKQIYYNEELHILPYLRPFVILMLLPLSVTITTALDTVGTKITEAANGSNLKISKRITDNAKKLQEAIDKKWDKIGSDEDLYLKTFGTHRSEDDSFSGAYIADDIKLYLGQTKDEMKVTFAILIQNLLVTAMYVAEAALLLMSRMFRLILAIGFPIALVLAIFPGFTNNLQHWFAKYTQFMLLPAVAAIYSSVCFGLLDQYLATIQIDYTSGSEGSNPEFLGFAFIGILLLSLVGYFFVPSMTNMLINVGGVGNIISGATRQAQGMAATTGRGMAKTAAVAGGGLKGAVTGGAAGAQIGKSISSSIPNSGRPSVAKSAAIVTGGAAGAAIGAVAGVAKSITGKKK